VQHRGRFRLAGMIPGVVNGSRDARPQLIVEEHPRLRPQLTDHHESPAVAIDDE
jgi:hypothetical protein